MANRQQRRMADKNPQVKAMSKKFAEEFTQMAVGFFEPLLEAERKGEKVDFNIDETAQRMFEAKGEELGKAMQEMMGSFTGGAVKQAKMNTSVKSIKQGPPQSITFGSKK